LSNPEGVEPSSHNGTADRRYHRRPGLGETPRRRFRGRFRLQDQATSRVVGEIAPKLGQAEIDR